MPSEPRDLTITDVQSRGFTVAWIVPAILFSEENLGYVLQVKQDDTCVGEVIYKCSNCIEVFPVIACLSLYCKRFTIKNIVCCFLSDSFFKICTYTLSTFSFVSLWYKLVM